MMAIDLTFQMFFIDKSSGNLWQIYRCLIIWF